MSKQSLTALLYFQSGNAVVKSNSIEVYLGISRHFFVAYTLPWHINSTFIIFL